MDIRIVVSDDASAGALAQRLTIVLAALVLECYERERASGDHRRVGLPALGARGTERQLTPCFGRPEIPPSDATPAKRLQY